MEIKIGAKNSPKTNNKIETIEPNPKRSLSLISISLNGQSSKNLLNPWFTIIKTENDTLSINKEIFLYIT